jgi:hypothetical protein
MRGRVPRALVVLGLVACFAARTGQAWKFVSIGSDDWGRWSGHGPAWPDSATRQLFWDEGLWLSGGEPSRATVETEHDLWALYALLEDINEGVPHPHRAVLTPFWVVAGPDFDAMRDSGCPGQGTCEYHELWWHNSSGGLARAPFDRGDLRATYRAGFQRGLWHPGECPAESGFCEGHLGFSRDVCKPSSCVHRVSHAPRLDDE